MIKRTIGMILCLSLQSAPIFAETTMNPGPEVIKFKMGDLVLPFSHWGHQKSLKNDCSPCHADTSWKIGGWSKETAHTLCIACHQTKKKGPVECKECHNVHYSKMG